MLNLTEIRRGVEIKIYSSPTCQWCRKTKEYLTEKGVEFTDYNVCEDRSKLQEMIELSGQRGVPVIKIGHDTPIIGFNKMNIDKALLLNCGIGGKIG